MLRDLSPFYTFEEALELVKSVDTYEGLKVLAAVISDDTDNYTAREYLWLQKIIGSKTTELLMAKADKALEANNKRRLGLDTEEDWKDIPGYEGLYKVSNTGRVKSFQYARVTGRIMKLRLDERGYCRVMLHKNKEVKNCQVHRLVAIAFIENKENKPCINHINGIHHDNRLENLEWCTYSENNKHAFDAGLKQSEKNGSAKLKAHMIPKIREMLKAGVHQRIIAKEFGVSQGAINSINVGRTWTNS